MRNILSLACDGSPLSRSSARRASAAAPAGSPRSRRASPRPCNDDARIERKGVSVGLSLTTCWRRAMARS